ncbi:VanZ family protein [bacterium]|nr:VanZ family protein [bacterium]
MKINFRLTLLAGWTLLVFLLISFPMAEYEGDVVTYYDKIAHIIMFGLFSFLLANYLSTIKRLRNSLIVAISILAGAMYAGMAEYLQIFIPGRTVSEYDFFAGLIGVALAQFLSYGILFKKRKT